jgi:ERCC4-related helicase
VVCLVVDEAHRATGHYAYTVVASEIFKVNPLFRILGRSCRW